RLDRPTITVPVSSTPAPKASCCRATSGQRRAARDVGRVASHDQRGHPPSRENRPAHASMATFTYGSHENSGRPGNRATTSFGWPGSHARRAIVAMNPHDRPPEATSHLRKYAWLAIVTAVLTVLLKGGARAITSSAGLLSDAAESMVALVAAIVAL